MSRCGWNSDGQQCHFPGVFSHGLNGGGPWKCAWHFHLQGTRDDQMTGALIVSKSQEWDGTAEQYNEWRSQRANRHADEVHAHRPSVSEGAVVDDIQPHGHLRDFLGAVEARLPKDRAELASGQIQGGSSNRVEVEELEPGAMG